MNRGQHRAPRERGGEPDKTATRPAPVSPEAMIEKISHARYLADKNYAEGNPRAIAHADRLTDLADQWEAALAPQPPAMARLYVPAPVTVPDWGHMLDAEDFLAAYDAHMAPMVRSLVWAFYRDAAGETETEFMAAIARTR